MDLSEIFAAECYKMETHHFIKETSPYSTYFLTQNLWCRYWKGSSPIKKVCRCHWISCVWTRDYTPYTRTSTVLVRPQRKSSQKYWLWRLRITHYSFKGCIVGPNRNGSVNTHKECLSQEKLTCHSFVDHWNLTSLGPVQVKYSEVLRIMCTQRPTIWRKTI